MADLREELFDILKFVHWRIPDPGPPWLRELLDRETQVKVAINQLQLVKATYVAQVEAIDRQIQILGGGGTR